MIKTFLSIAMLWLGCLSAQATDFDIAGSYAQSRDFWKTVQGVQDKTGNIPEIQSIVRDRYGQPDILYSYLEASYAYPHNWFESSSLDRAIIGTRAEALAGGQISNPISPEIQAYANSVGIVSFGLSNSPHLETGGFFQVRSFFGYGPEKRLFAQGAEFIDAIPVRSGTLFLAGADAEYDKKNSVGDDFWITTSLYLRGTYFHSTVPQPKSKTEDLSFATWRWRLQNEWLKETEPFLFDKTRLGLITVIGQNPLPFLQMPVTWDYQQRLQFFPGLGSLGGLGGMARFLSENSLPNMAFYAGYFGGAFGGGMDFQLKSVLLQASSYGVESMLTPDHETTRLWSLSLAVAL